MQAIKANFQCHCGKVKGVIDSPSALRLVCYCRDCRGYYNTLNNLAAKMGLLEPPAKLDPFGGSDFTQIYPSEIKILEGKNQLETCIIREKSGVHRTYAKCCYTPLFSTGPSGAALFNSNLISSDDQKCEVNYRIIGRQALKGDGSVKKPPMSFSVPFGWFFTMPKRIKKDKILPSPVEIKEGQEIKVLEGFKEG
mmetsp:Transcript_32750/g.69136  ORF Transcript_32750/g.69136 Transcript_32750/m.69136 type:complete len:195 (-) Transcript_32750:54-638(-)